MPTTVTITFTDSRPDGLGAGQPIVIETTLVDDDIDALMTEKILRTLPDGSTVADVVALTPAERAAAAPGALTAWAEDLRDRELQRVRLVRERIAELAQVIDEPVPGAVSLTIGAP